MPAARVRAVVDTNVLIRGVLRLRMSAAVSVFDALVDRQFEAVTSDYVLDEVAKTLREPDVRLLRALTDPQIDALVDALRATMDVVPGQVQGLDKVPTDLKDNPVLAAALEGGAGYLVTADAKDLLPLKVIKISGFRPVQVIAPGPFIKYVVGA